MLILRPVGLQMIISSITAQELSIRPSVAQEIHQNDFSCFEFLVFFHVRFPKRHKKMNKAPKALKTPEVRVLFVAPITTSKSAFVNIRYRKINLQFPQQKSRISISAAKLN
jgi:hypothetical protein